MLGTHSFANINTGKVFVKEVKNLFGVTLVIVHINLATKFITYEIKTSERIVVLKVFSRMIKFSEVQGSTFPMQHRLWIIAYDIWVRLSKNYSGSRKLSNVGTSGRALEHIPLTLSNWSLFQVRPTISELCLSPLLSLKYGSTVKLQFYCSPYGSLSLSRFCFFRKVLYEINTWSSLFHFNDSFLMILKHFEVWQ